MRTLIALLPLYLLGNLHCAGMCGPLVMMLGRHRYRHLYFVGRVLSFSLTGMLAGEVGALVTVSLPIGEAACFLFGAALLVLGSCQLLRIRVPLPALGRVNERFSLLLLRDQPLATLLFGASTVLLPCGQTVIVFTACAVEQQAWSGLLNGFAFAMLTSPALWFAMHARHLLKRLPVEVITGCLAILAGGLALCRGLAASGMIPHLVLSERLHLVAF